MKSVFNVKNLTTSELLSSTGNNVKLASDEVKNRIEGITFFHFDYNIYPSSQDSCIIQGPLYFQFSLRLPQQHYDNTTKMVHNIRSTAKRSHISSKKATVMASIPGSGGAKLFHNPVWNGNDGAGHIPPSNSIGTLVPPATQKMSVLFNRQSNEIKVGYFGKLEFIDNKKDFEKTFGDKPTILSPKLVSQDSSTAAKMLYAYSEKCTLDAFLHMCRKNYVGHDSVDNSLSTQDVCRRVSYLRQE